MAAHWRTLEDACISADDAADEARERARELRAQADGLRALAREWEDYADAMEDWRPPRMEGFRDEVPTGDDDSASVAAWREAAEASLPDLPADPDWPA